MFSRLTLALMAAMVMNSPLPAQPKPTAATALDKLKDGNARFAADKPSTRDTKADKRKELAKGQHPFAVILTCADSRVAPELLFDAGLGELFVLRVAGNIADPAVVGSIEYAVEHLHAPLIVVLGHDSCGAVAAALDGKPLPGDLGWLIKQVKVGDNLPAEADAKMSAAIRHNARAAAKDLELRSKVIHEEVKEKKVAIVTAVYSLKTGNVEWLMSEKKAEAPKKRPGAEKIDAPKTEAKRVAGPLPTPAGSDHEPGTTYLEPGRFSRLRAFFQRRH